MVNLKDKIKAQFIKLIGFVNYHQIVEFKNSVLKNTEYNSRKDALIRMTTFYSTFINKDDLCFDVGANMGNRVEAFLKIGAKVVAIEPQKKCCDYLRKKFGKQIDLVSKGCGDKEEVKQFFISDASTISSFSEEWISKVRDGRFKEHNWNETASIQMTTLDILIKQYGLPKFLKIDVEGFEPEVLSGLSFPIQFISFEYAEPEQHSNTIQCTNRLHKINNDVLFNYTVGESMEFSKNGWLNYEQMLAYIETQKFIQSGFGDIYAQNI